MFRRLMILVLALALGLVACGEQRQDPAQGGGGKLEVVATYSILGDLVKNVGGDDVELTTLVGPDGDAHTFEPAPADAAKLSEADLVFENGLEFETWLSTCW